jgi:site-specific DNA-methyltransferase (adenine-specific)
MNQLLYGDNIEIMKKMPSESIDLIYLDPPFNSNKNYNFLYSQATGLPLPEEAEAFCDAWKLDEGKETTIRKIGEEMLQGGVNSEFISFWENWIKALRSTNSKLLAYMVFMTERLVEMKRLLKSTGSIYLHCDPTASHYIKVIMDGIFGYENFRNEIVWCYSNSGRSKSSFAWKHDIILAYSKEEKYFWSGYKIPISEKYLKSHYRQKDKDGKNCRIRIDAGKERIYYPEDGMTCNDWWSDLPSLNSQAKERLGYPTQKPLALLDRIIKASCPEDGTVLDPFCGCGTTVISAQTNNRKWVGIDICMLAANAMEERLKNLFPHLQKGKDYRLDGLPTTVEQAIALANSSNATKNEGRYQFQYWAIEKVGGFASTKKSGDGGVDGSIYFYKDLEGKGLGKMIISVKSDKDLKIAYIRDLVGTLANDKTAEMAGLICIDEPTDGMKTEAMKAGFYEVDFGLMGKQSFQKVQILTIKDIIENDKKFQTPFKVQKKIAEHVEQKNLNNKQNELLLFK